jgi:hypothetical protein
MMALKIPTTKELSGQNLAGLEGQVGQTAPLTDKAFLRVLAAVLALAHTGLYKFGAERALQNLALTATGADLDLIGAEYETPRKLAETAVLSVTITGTNGISIPATASFIGDANGIRYYVDAAASISGGSATLSLTAESAGVSGNLQPSDTLTIVSPIAGASSTATVSAVTTTGADAEDDATYRPRVRFAMRAVTGGSNATDHKIWAEAVAGVARAFPFAGKPVGGGTSYPGDRTVYVEADTSLDPDGIPSSSLLDDVRAALLVDPDTGLSRPALGITDVTLYVEPITRTAFDIAITNLTTPAGLDATVKAAITASLDSYFATVATYVEGVDLPADRNDEITNLTISDVIQGVLFSYSSSAEDVAIEVAATPYDSYQLAAGELAKTGTVSYVVV